MVHFLVVDSATRTWNWSSYRRCLRQSPVVGQMVSPIHSRQAFSPTHPAYHCANGQDFHHLAHTILTTPDFKRPSFWCIVGISWKCHFRRAFMFHQQQDETQNSSSRVKCELFIMWFLTSSPSSPPKKGRFIFFTKRSVIQKKQHPKNRNIFPPHPSSGPIFGNLLPRSQSRHHVYLGSRRLGKSPQKRTEKSSVASKKPCHHWTFCLKM